MMPATRFTGKSHTPDANGASGDHAATRYAVLERVGEGTLWITYRVRDRDSGQNAALKALKNAFLNHAVLPNALASHLTQLAGADFSHPNLALPFDVGEEEGTLFQVTEWISNAPLEHRLRRAPFGQAETVSYLRQITQALEALHAHGFTHGDLRPAQIMQSGNGNIKLTDAGLADALHDAQITLTDICYDASFYLAPERWDGQAPSPSADLYALGCLLYRMLAGRVPFDGPSPLSIAMRHRNDAPLLPSQFNLQCPPDLEAIALKLLAKQPADRFASATELLEELNHGAFAPATAAPLAAPIAPAESTAVATVTPADEDEQLLDETDSTDFDEKLARKKQRRREGWSAFRAFLWTLLSIGLLSGILYGAYYFWVQDTPREVQVPKYIGKNQFDAENALAAKGLKLRVTREVYDPKRPSGTVISGELRAGKKVRVGREIGVTVSRGEEPINMYNFSELTLTQARRIMQRDGLRLGQVAEQYHDRVPAGYICGQYPEPGEPFRRSEPINLIVSKGSQPSETPIAAPELPTDNSEIPLENPSDQQSYTSPESVPDVTLVSRAVSVRVAIPSGGKKQEVRVVVQDAEGEHTVYRKTHNPGELVNETIQVTRQQGATATVRIYVGGALRREIRI